MCTEHKIAEMAGLHEKHLPILREAAPSQADIIDRLYQVLTADLCPHLPVLPALIAMIEALKNNDFGVLGERRLVRLPLSIIGIDRVRYRTPIVEWLHETILSMKMSDHTVMAIRQALQKQGLGILFLSSCGVLLGRDKEVQGYFGSGDHLRMERVRSAIETAGNPVASVDLLTDIVVQTIDLHDNGAEARLLARIDELIQSAAKAGHPDYSWIDDELAYFLESTLSFSAAA